MSQFKKLYVELSTVKHPFFYHKNLEDRVRKDLYESFVECGGIDIDEEEYVGDKVRVRSIFSTWSTYDGYEKWLTNARSQEYIKMRDEYNKQYHILSIPVKDIDE